MHETLKYNPLFKIEITRRGEGNLKQIMQFKKYSYLNFMNINMYDAYTQAY